MIQKLKNLLFRLRLKLTTYLYAPTIIKDDMNKALNQSNKAIEDKVMVHVANNANKWTKKLIKWFLIIAILVFIILIISSAWSALEISVDGEIIKEAIDVKGQQQ